MPAIRDVSLCFLCGGGTATLRPPVLCEAPRLVGAERFDQEMEMIARDGITRKLPAMANHGLLEPFDQPLPVRTIADNLLPRISPRGLRTVRIGF
jgi:hypothetical protein